MLIRQAKDQSCASQNESEHVYDHLPGFLLYMLCYIALIFGSILANSLQSMT
jgi:hypothetical protein